MIKPAYYLEQEMVCLYDFKDLGPAPGQIVKVSGFGYVPEAKGMMLAFDGSPVCYQAKYFIDRKDFNSLMLALPKGHIPAKLVPVPKEYKLN